MLHNLLTHNRCILCFIVHGGNSRRKKPGCFSSYLEHGVVVHFTLLWSEWDNKQQTQIKQNNSPANLWKKHFLGKKNKNKTTTGVFRDKNKNKNEELRKFILAKPVVNSGGKNILEKKIKSSLASRGFRNVLTIHSASKTCSGSKCTFNIWGAVRENYGQIMKPCQM